MDDRFVVLIFYQPAAFAWGPVDTLRQYLLPVQQPDPPEADPAWSDRPFEQCPN